MYRRTGKMVILACVLTLALATGGMAQQPPQPHPEGPLPPDRPAGTDAATPGPMRPPMQGMRGHGGMMGERAMMIQHHLDQLTQHLKLSDAQRTQAQTLMRTHAKEVIRLTAEIDTMGLDVPPLLEADPVDMAKVKQLLQTLAAKEVDLRLAHITAMQDIRKLLTPEQQKQFRTMQSQMMGHDMMGSGGMMEHGKMKRGPKRGHR